MQPCLASFSPYAPHVRTSRMKRIFARFTSLICNLLQGFKQYPRAWRLRPLWMTRRSCKLLTITYPRVSNTINCCQSLQGPFQGLFLQPSWGSRTSQRLTPLTAYGGSHDHAWTSNLNAAQTNVNESLSAHSGHHSAPSPSAMQSGETTSKALYGSSIYNDGAKVAVLTICKNAKS